MIWYKAGAVISDDMVYGRTHLLDPTRAPGLSLTVTGAWKSRQINIWNATLSLLRQKAVFIWLVSSMLINSNTSALETHFTIKSIHNWWRLGFSRWNKKNCDIYNYFDCHFYPSISECRQYCIVATETLAIISNIDKMTKMHQLCNRSTWWNQVSGQEGDIDDGECIRRVG